MLGKNTTRGGGHKAWLIKDSWKTTFFVPKLSVNKRETTKME
jgi:hypothetical protein